MTPALAFLTDRGPAPEVITVDWLLDLIACAMVEFEVLPDGAIRVVDPDRLVKTCPLCAACGEEGSAASTCLRRLLRGEVDCYGPALAWGSDSLKAIWAVEDAADQPRHALRPRLLAACGLEGR